MSIENEQLREKLEKKYNLNLNILDNEGGKTYEDLIEYFTKEIKQDNLLISTTYATMCCMCTDINAMKEDFNEQLKEFTQFRYNCLCFGEFLL